ncbi:prophage maintenance system killer protein [Tenggerimyces flavus]|nr:prophage maintenance system killer protein [Tenggerimyces flavus]
MRALDLADLLAIAARILDRGSTQIVEETDLELLAITAADARSASESGELSFPAAVLLHGLVTHRPFRRLNRRIAVAATVQFVSLNGGRFELEPVEHLNAVLDLSRLDKVIGLLRHRVRNRPTGPGPAPPPIEGTSGKMFERFTDRARRVVVLAQEEARDLNHNYIGTEHVLLGLVHEGDGVAAKVLEALGIQREAIRTVVLETIGEGSHAPSGHIPFTPRAKRVMELALREALQFSHNYIGTEHLLLGLVREGEGVAAQALVKLGAELDTVRTKVLEHLKGYQSDAPLTSLPSDAPLRSRRVELHDELDALLEENSRLRAENRRLRRRLEREGFSLEELFRDDDWPDEGGLAPASSG